MAGRGEPYGVASILVSDRDNRVVWIKEDLHLLNNLCTWTPAEGAGSQRVAEYLQASSCTVKHGNIPWFAKQNAGGGVTKAASASSHLRTAQRTPCLWVYKGRFSSKNRFTGARPEKTLAICLYGQSIADPAVNQDERQGFWFQLPPPPPQVCSSTVVHWLYSGFCGPRCDWSKTGPVKICQHSPSLTFWIRGYSNSSEDAKPADVNRKSSAPADISWLVEWRQLGIAGASVASKVASANVWWDSGD